MPSIEGHPGIHLHLEEQAGSSNGNIFYSWMVEECILASYDTKVVECPTHANIPLSQIAPDTVSIIQVLLFNLFITSDCISILCYFCKFEIVLFIISAYVSSSHKQGRI